MHLVATILETNSSTLPKKTHHCFISVWESLTHLVFGFKYAVIKLHVESLSPYQTHFFFHSLSLAQLPLTAAFTSSRSPALHCHSSSVSFSSPLPHGTTSVWKVLCMPCWRGFRQMVQWESWEQLYLFVSGVTLHANRHRPCPDSAHHISKAVQRFHQYLRWFSCNWYIWHMSHTHFDRHAFLIVTLMGLLILHVNRNTVDLCHLRFQLSSN